MAVFLSNSFSLGMLVVSPEQPLTLRVRALTLEEAKSLLREGFISAVGHQSTAEILSVLLGVEVPFNRTAITMRAGDALVVFQLRIRLQEGQILSAEEVKALYDQGQASFMLVEVVG
ncbi:STIV orfB116 family protein [Thermocrinis sp.]|uniref:STIV orfB116 family protein n=1 Tax=Thermocrinis sp. TaxID=2024383 RepID=UPI003C0A8A48